VNPNAPPTYTTGGIQDGVDFASAGDTIEAVAGTYAELLNVNKPLTLSGAGVGLSVIDATGFGQPFSETGVIDITALAGNTTIEGFDIKTGDYYDGIYSSGGTDGMGTIQILNNHIISTDYGEPQFGIIAGYGELRALTISGNEISNTYDNSILVEMGDGPTTITGNTLNGGFPSMFFMTYNGNNVTPQQLVSGNIIDMSTADPDTDNGGIEFNPSTSYVDPEYRTGRYHKVIISNNIIKGLGDASFKGISCGESSGDGSGGFDSLSISGNTISGTNGKGIQFYGHIVGAGVHNNTVTGLLQGIKDFTYLTSFAPTGISVTCNRIEGNTTGVLILAGDATANRNVISGNTTDADNQASPQVQLDFTDNWWGVPSTCGVLVGDINCSGALPAPPGCVNCRSSEDCSDTLTCNGAETCNLSTGMCQAGTPLDCSSLSDSCHVGTCEEPSGCVAVAKPDHTSCNDGNACTKNDVCTAGVCGGTPYTCGPPDLCHQGAGTCNGDGTCSYASNFNNELCHNIVVKPVNPVNVTIPGGQTAVAKTFSVIVQDADPRPPRGTPHNMLVQLVATSVDCPAGTIVGVPSFVGWTGGSPDTVWVDPTGRRTAKVSLNISSAAFTSFNNKAPTRCTLTVMANVVSPLGSMDPAPENNSVTVELNVIDKNDLQHTTGGETLVKSIAPLQVTLNKGRTSVAKKVSVQVANADSNEPSGNVITVTVDPGDCPASLFSGGGVNFGWHAYGAQSNATRVMGGAATNGSLALTFNASDFATLNANSPTRCTAVLNASGQLATSPAADPTNNSAELVIDVIDKNDF
jgi:hypothetical protein